MEGKEVRLFKVGEPYEMSLDVLVSLGECKSEWRAGLCEGL